jgi:hypothetical protein
MLQQGPEKSQRRLVWVERSTFGGWGCSVCGWVFNPSGWPAGKSLDETIDNSQKLLTEEFDSHICVHHSQGGAKPPTPRSSSPF